ncbi:sugar phosphate isomerase/epimerase [Nocardioides dongxiaopingii]|uniref:sugar phosphate isomerase/epimerase family protein n=1 Tax=Nocardioides TaxID=1839 RepID=UPI0010C761BB|nr:MULTISPECIES: sugar phosphate isomerase/epimerase [Nocardioides]QCW51246.1 sugar phosphate isomerase/epimerase [Nocardioides sp. S-1144]
MCYGYDGEAALRQSLERQGASRRGLLRGAALGAAGLASVGALGATAAEAAGQDKANGRSRKKQVPEGRISIQLYTLRAAMTDPASVELALTRLSQYAYPRVERAGLYHYTAAQMKQRLDQLGIWASSSHDGISDSTAARNKKFDDANTLGQRYIVVPYLNSDKLSDWQAWAEQMNIEAYAAKRRGLKYGYHNHAHEFTIDLGGGKTPWDVLTQELDPRLVHLEADLYWVYTGGVNRGEANPIKFVNDVIRKAPQTVRQFHVKDRSAAAGGDMCDLGTGVIDFPAIFRKHDAEEYIVENDTPDVSPLTSAAVGKLYLEHTNF